MRNSGYSLIEIMVVLAVITILAFIAMPSYKTYQARALQKEGTTLLSGYYIASQASLAEHGAYPGNLVQTNYSPVGQLGYRLTAADGTDSGISLNDDLCISTAAVCNCGGNCPNFRKWVDTGLGVVAGSIGAIATAGGACGALPALFMADQAYSIRVSGVISLSAAQQDEYGIDHMKNVVMCTDGTK